MYRTTRIWIGLGATVVVAGTAVDSAALVQGVASTRERPEGSALWPPAEPLERLFTAQDDGGEGGPGEGGGQVLGTITEFRLSSTAEGAFAYDASAQVAAYAELVHTAYVTAHAGTMALQAATESLLADPTPSTLVATREAWVAARPAFLRTEAFQFYAGPVDGPGGPLTRLNSWPVDPAFIEGIVADASVPLNFRALARLNLTDESSHVATGWHAIEFLLWGEDGAREAKAFAAGDGNNDRRRDFLAATAQLLVNDLSVLVAAWAPEANNYRASVEAMDQRNAIGRAFNGMTVLLGYEMPLRRIGAGMFPANPDFQQSPFSDTSAEDNRSAFEGARAVYYDTGIDVLVAAADPAIAADVDAAFDRAEAALAPLEAPYSRFLAPPAGSPERAAGEAAVRSLTDLGRELRRAGNRLGVLVVVPGI